VGGSVGSGGVKQPVRDITMARRHSNKASILIFLIRSTPLLFFLSIPQLKIEGKKKYPGCVQVYTAWMHQSTQQ
jgi:hypothetical protein